MSIEKGEFLGENRFRKGEGLRMGRNNRLSVVIFSLCIFLVILNTSEVEPNANYDWVFMVYMDGDNNLEGAAIDDFLKMASVGSTERIVIVVQFDRIPGYDSSYGDWTGCARFEISQGDTPVLENAVENLEEVDMGDSETLRDFVEWGTRYYAAEHYALVLWNHGGGWRERMERLKGELRTKGKSLSQEEKQKIFSEIQSLEKKLKEKEGILKAVCWDDTDGGVLYTREIREALEAIPYGIDLVGFDACLMGMIEVAHEIRNQASVMVSSQKTEPFDGWPYNTILSDLAGNPDMSPAEFGITIVQRYGNSYNGYHTLSAVDLTEISDLSNAVSDFAQTVIDEDEDWLAIFNAKQQAGYYSYTYYRDLKGFIEGVVDNATNANIRSKAKDVREAFDDCIIANHSSASDKGNGLSIYFADWGSSMDPDYRGGFKEERGDDANSNIQFARDTHWDEFLSKYVDAYLVPEHTGVTTFRRAVLGGRSVSDYVMISSPVEPLTSNPYQELEDDLGPYKTNIWRLFRWEPELNPPRYIERPSPGGTIVGDGVWLISCNSVNIDFTGRLQETNRPFLIDLAPGWNQIGTPFNFSIDWDTVMVTNGVSTYFVTSYDNYLTYWTLWKYLNGSYSASARMMPGWGYWVKNLTNRDVYLIVMPIPSTFPRDYIESIENELTKAAESEETPPPPPSEGISDSGGDVGESTESTSSSGGSGCFIATACFGSPMAGEVEVLRTFRDRYLLTNPLGIKLVSLYYRHSPPVARFIKSHKSFRIIGRFSLYPLIKGCKLVVEE
ncbi:MAG TPA: hypothetical protein EYP78_01050 [Candidatus Omnitrophica bacterium]|nr:hypothetical protein [Candidatus Omnitrophota bacterium]